MHTRRIPLPAHTILIASMAALWLVSVQPVAQASPVCNGKEQLRIVTGDTETVRIGLLKYGDVRISVPSGLHALEKARTGPLLHEMSDPSKRTLYLRFHSKAPIGAVASIRVWSKAGFEMRLDIELVGRVEEASPDQTIMHISEVERERERINAMDLAHVGKSEERDAQGRLGRVEGSPLVEQAHQQNGPISLHVHRAEWEGDLMYVYFTADSHVAQSHKLEAIAALDARGQPIPCTRVYFEKSGPVQATNATGINLAPGVMPVNVSLGGNQRVKGLFVIPWAADMHRNMLGLRLYRADQSVVTETILEGWQFQSTTANARMLDGQRGARNGASSLASRRERLRRVADFLLGLKSLQGQDGEIALNRSGASLAAGIARPGEIRAALDWAVLSDGEHYGIVTLHNRTGVPVTVTRAAVARRGELEGVPAVIAWEKSATTRHETVRIDDKQTVRAVVEIPDEFDGPLDAMEVHLLGIGGITVASTEIIELYPIPDDVRRRRRMSRQITVSVRGLFGGFWTGDAAGQDRVDGTTMAGVGVRVQKGYEWGAGFEGEIVVARTGQASFEDMSWDGMMGNVTRQATLGRGMGGFAMRVGHDLVLTGRLGVGVQVASYDSTFAATGGSVTDGPGDGIEVDGLWATGASLDARLGEHWSIGATMNFAGTFQTGSRSLEGGIHLGYGINTKRSFY